jgi:hypothetical protein
MACVQVEDAKSVVGTEPVAQNVSPMDSQTPLYVNCCVIALKTNEQFLVLNLVLSVPPWRIRRDDPLLLAIVNVHDSAIRKSSSEFSNVMLDWAEPPLLTSIPYMKRLPWNTRSTPAVPLLSYPTPVVTVLGGALDVSEVAIIDTGLALVPADTSVVSAVSPFEEATQIVLPATQAPSAKAVEILLAAFAHVSYGEVLLPVVATYRTAIF